MIYTITFNPAIDLVVKVPNCELGTLNRSVEENYVAGGKGINMSVILKKRKSTLMGQSYPKKISLVWYSILKQTCNWAMWYS